MARHGVGGDPCSRDHDSRAEHSCQNSYEEPASTSLILELRLELMGQPEKKSVLFVCTGNSCRSQMAEGLLREIAGERFEASSAGTNPSRVNPIAVRVMAELG